MWFSKKFKLSYRIKEGLIVKAILFVVTEIKLKQFWTCIFAFWLFKGHLKGCLKILIGIMRQRGTESRKSKLGTDYKPSIWTCNLSSTSNGFLTLKIFLYFRRPYLNNLDFNWTKCTTKKNTRFISRTMAWRWNKCCKVFSAASETRA